MQFYCAFQVLGYYTWEHDGDYRKALEEYRQYLEDYVYDKIWSELSAKDRELTHAIAVSDTGKVSDILQIMGIQNNQFSPYRKRLQKKGQDLFTDPDLFCSLRHCPLPNAVKIRTLFSQAEIIRVFSGPVK